MNYLYLKSLHLIFVVSWFAGLLYVVRLFVYHVEAGERPESERRALQPQFAIMERRLWYGIAWPAMILTTLFGAWMMLLIRAWQMPWFHLKLGLVALLFAYHLYCGKVRRDLAAGACRLTSKRLRVWNEIGTLLLIAIIFAAVTKSPAMAGRAIVWVALIAAIGVAILVYVRRKQALRAPDAPDGNGGPGQTA